MTPAAPHEDSYWVHLPAGMVAAGEYPGDLDPVNAREKIRAILDSGITCFLDLTGPDELTPYEPVLRKEAARRGVTVEHVRYVIPDMQVCATGEMTTIMRTIHLAVAAGKKVYVHCWGGVGRTGTVVGCWLVEQGMTPQDALGEVARAFSTMSRAKRARHPEGSPQTHAQKSMVRSWRPSLRTRSEAPLRLATRDRGHLRGCLLGGAVGDALGAPVEFMTLSEIRREFGALGIRDFAEAYGKLGAITDDTQMTLFTAEGVMRGVNRGFEKGIGYPSMCVYHAYLRWLGTQGVRGPEVPLAAANPGWLVKVPELRARRAPGNTCLSALRSGTMGTVDAPVNQSKGCGGVMRAAPFGLMRHVDAFTLACDCAAITHGHPSGYLAAGCLALIIERIVSGSTLSDAVTCARERVAMEPGHEEVACALDNAVAAAAEATPSAERVEMLGKGWVAEEALSIAVYCALAADGDFERGVVLAVNHSGDSDSTGAIAGNILGALLGVGAIPGRWFDAVELSGVIEQLADDLLVSYRDDAEWAVRYPPN